MKEPPGLLIEAVPFGVRIVRLPCPNLARIGKQSGAGFASQNEPLRRRKTKNEDPTLLFHDPFVPLLFRDPFVPRPLCSVLGMMRRDKTQTESAGQLRNR